MIRPINSIFIGFAVIVGALISSTDLFFLEPGLLIFGFLTGFFISSYSMIINDVYDIEIDRVNNPEKPLPKGIVTINQAIKFSISILILGLFFSLITSIENFILAIFFSLISWVYNYWGKKKGFIGNVMVATSVSIPFLYGGIMGGSLSNTLIIFLTFTSFLASLGREIVKTISDVSGDAVRNINSLARQYGSKKAGLISASLFLLAVLSTLIPILYNLVGLIFIILVIFPNAIFIYSSIKIMSNQSAKESIKVKNLTLLGILLGLVTFILGGASI